MSSCHCNNGDKRNHWTMSSGQICIWIKNSRKQDDKYASCYQQLKADILCYKLMAQTKLSSKCCHHCGDHHNFTNSCSNGGNQIFHLKMKIPEGKIQLPLSEFHDPQFMFQVFISTIKFFRVFSFFLIGYFS